MILIKIYNGPLLSHQRIYIQIWSKARRKKPGEPFVFAENASGITRLFDTVILTIKGKIVMCSHDKARFFGKIHRKGGENRLRLRMVCVNARYLSM